MALVMTNRERGNGRGYWHSMGTISSDPDETATQAAINAGLDYTITKKPLMVRGERARIVNVPDYFAVMSTAQGDPDVIAVVGKEFQPVQNMHLAEVLDNAGLTGPGGMYSMDVAGKTVDGRTVFWALKSRQLTTIKGDEYRDHWIIMDGKDGNRALTMALTPVRTVCSNALAMAVSGASIKVGIQHTKAAEKELAWWLSVAPQLQAASIKSKEVLERLGGMDATEAMLDSVLDAAYPLPALKGRAQLASGLEGLGLNAEDAATVTKAKDSHSVDRQRQLAKRDYVEELFFSYADTPEEKNIAGSLLGVVNAVADFENHRDANSTREVVGVSNLYGPRYAAQANALKAAISLAR